MYKTIQYFCVYMTHKWLYFVQHLPLEPMSLQFSTCKVKIFTLKRRKYMSKLTKVDMLHAWTPRFSQDLRFSSSISHSICHLWVQESHTIWSPCIAEEHSNHKQKVHTWICHDTHHLHVSPRMNLVLFLQPGCLFPLSLSPLFFSLP